MKQPSIEAARLAKIAERASAVVDEVSNVFVGPRDIAELLLVALLARGHVLLEGVPGVAKTTLAKAFAGTLGCSFKRVQFTPDLLPADITGTYVLAPNEGRFELRTGPIFANVVLADEINRAPAKTQSALLEAMQEFQATIEGETRALPEPFLIVATQNPVEQAGTYPLPEAQIDRFLMRVIIGYPSPDDEARILLQFAESDFQVQPLLSPDEIRGMQALVRTVHVENDVVSFIVRLARFPREHPQVFLGASPRASLALMQAVRARALLFGRGYVLPDDVKRLAAPVLAHRLVLTPEAEMEGFEGEMVVRQALEQVGHRQARLR